MRASAAGRSGSRTCVARASQRTEMVTPALASLLRLGLQALFQAAEQNAQAVPASGYC